MTRWERFCLWWLSGGSEVVAFTPLGNPIIMTRRHARLYYTPETAELFAQLTDAYVESIYRQHPQWRNN